MKRRRVEVGMGEHGKHKHPPTDDPRLQIAVKNGERGLIVRLVLWALLNSVQYYTNLYAAKNEECQFPRTMPGWLQL